MIRHLLAVVAALAVLLVASSARADASTTTFALVVTSNRSARLARPDLRYADDDGAKYHAMFRMIAPEANVVLLTSFDPDSEKLYPELARSVRPPTLANVNEAARSLAERVRVAAASGPVDFYFVFAGHGDVERGKGFLEFADGPFQSDDLATLLRSVPATHSHVILDSCNAFFAIQARKPGGRHFVTSEEAQRSLASRLPSVGVFLSTSAEGNVYEWSSIQSGVFSHAVRSGLAGGADADGDGHVTYDELRAFVNVAARDVKNPAYRPQVFARGPAGAGSAVLFDLSRARGKRLRLDGKQQRMTVRDAVDVPWFEVHKEAGGASELVLPDRFVDGMVDERHADGSVTRHALGPATEATDALALTSQPTAGAQARGADEVFLSFFAQPFGPMAFAKFVREQADETPLVLGVGPEERERLRLLLWESSDAARRSRFVGAPLLLGANLGLGALGGLALAGGIRNDKPLGYAVGIGAIGAGTFGAVTETLRLFRPSFEEATYARFVRDAGSPDPLTQQTAYARAEARLLSAAATDAHDRAMIRWPALAVFTLYGGTLTAVAASGEKLPGAVWAAFGGASLFGGVVFFESLFKTPTERMAELWRSDPTRTRTSGFTMRPVFGLTSVGVVGAF